MKNLMNYGVATAMALIALGVFHQQPINANQTSVKRSETTVKTLNEEAVVFPDIDLRDSIMRGLKVADPAALTPSKLAEVNRLYLKGTISDFTGMSYLSNIESIEIDPLYKGRIRSRTLGELTTLKKLKVLELSDAERKGALESIDHIQDMSNLVTLSVPNHALTDISPLTDKAMKYVSIEGNHVTDVTPLAKSLAAGAQLKLGNQTYTTDVIVGKLAQHIKIPVQVKNIDGSIPKIIPGPGVSVTNDGSFLEFDLSKDTKEFTFTWEGNNGFTGSATIPVHIKNQDDQKGDTRVEFNHKPIPVSTWYGVIPSTINLNDSIKEEEAVVKIVDGQSHKSKYSGDSNIDVKIQSQNGFRLIDANHRDEPIMYQFDEYGDGSKILKDDTKEEDMGCLNKDHSEFDSKVKVIGDAADGGTFVDVLHYHFIEK